MGNPKKADDAQASEAATKADDAQAPAPAAPVAEASAEHRIAAKKRSAAAKSNDGGLDTRTKQLLDALGEERRGYVLRGKDARVKQVDEQIALLKKSSKKG